MSEEIKYARRRFLGTVAMTVSLARGGSVARSP